MQPQWHKHRSFFHRPQAVIGIVALDPCQFRRIRDLNSVSGIYGYGNITSGCHCVNSFTVNLNCRIFYPVRHTDIKYCSCRSICHFQNNLISFRIIRCLFQMDCVSVFQSNIYFSFFYFFLFQPKIVSGDIRPCKHNGRLPGVSRTKPPVIPDRRL